MWNETRFIFYYVNISFFMRHYILHKDVANVYCRQIYVHIITPIFFPLWNIFEKLSVYQNAYINMFLTCVGLNMNIAIMFSAVRFCAFTTLIFYHSSTNIPNMFRFLLTVKLLSHYWHLLLFMVWMIHRESINKIK